MKTLCLLTCLFSLTTIYAQVDTLALIGQRLGLHFSPDQLKMMEKAINDRSSDYEKMREEVIENSVSPAFHFDPRPHGFVISTVDEKPINWSLPKISLPQHPGDLAFYSILELATLIKSREISCVALTNFFLSRIKMYSDTLKCTISVTEDLALQQAQRADSLLDQGIWLGPLHGIPYGAKDLFSVPGYKTSWGAAPFQDQTLVETSDVVEKLTSAGAVLVAKLTLGALAMGDVWYGGMTRNPWNLEQGSSGSSAGSASATVAGLVPFALGTETRGSITSPSTRCGATGLRPTFGRVSRAGAMALSWTMDKIGPICRSAEDCAIVFDVIRGKGRDNTVIEAPFPYDQDLDVRQLKVGYFKNLFDSCEFTRPYDEAALQTLRSMGLNLQEVHYKIEQPVEAIGFILIAEAAAAFDELTRSGRDSLLVRQHEHAWPNTFRAARYIPAVEYIQANRIRSLLMDEFHKLISGYDVIVTPTFEGTQILTTNLTGQPVVTLPHGFAEDGTPRSITFLGNLFEEHKILALAQAFQLATDFEDRHPLPFRE
ncbi:MAG: amidase [Saprospiraceae bacterium]|nr:amidase [Saprospiraceae bacterium]